MNKEEKLQILRHSAAHLLAQATLELYPQTILTIGPATAEGFFYDVLPQRNFKEEDLALLEAKMHELSKKNLPITHEEISKEKARIIFKDNPFKMELIESIPGDTVGLSRQGDFYDLCRGGHVASTGDIKYFKLLNISGSYWRADRNNQPLQRITGTAFLTKEDLDDYEKRKEEAELYDHRRLGKQLDLFSFHEEGVGFPFFHPKGKTVINVLIDYLKKILNRYEYQEIATPIMLSDDLWKQSGHYAHYKDNMYFCAIDEKTYAIRPMNCPGAILTYKERPRSYRELPLKLAEFGLVHRHELSGVLHGLFRVRAFTQDDAHVFCTIDQLHQEISSMISMIFEVYKKFGFTSIKVAVSTKPAKAMGNDALWQKATEALTKALDEQGITYQIQEGEGAFYGPKIECSLSDCLGRIWQCGTIQVDFSMPNLLGASFVSEEGSKQVPVMLHRAILGSFERFIGILIEHHAGKFPVWLSPVQIVVLTISEKQDDYAQRVYQQLQNSQLRAAIDLRNEKIGFKIREHTLLNVPYMLIIGDKEVETGQVTLRTRAGADLGMMTIESVCDKMRQAIAMKD